MSISNPYPGQPDKTGSTYHIGGKKPITAFLPHDHKERDEEILHPRPAAVVKEEPEIVEDVEDEETFNGIEDVEDDDE